MDKGRASINFEFSNDEGDGLKPLKFDVYPCNTKVENETIKGFTNVSTCTCAYCETSCNVTKQSFVPPDYFEGFNLLLVAIVYAVLLAVIIGGYYVAKMIKRKYSEENESTERLSQ